VGDFKVHRHDQKVADGCNFWGIDLVCGL
jgi:hypothetical protein